MPGPSYRVRDVCAGRRARYAEPPMTTPDLPEPSDHTGVEARLSRLERRRDKIRREIQQNREGGHRVPTWVLALLLLLFVGGWAFLILRS